MGSVEAGRLIALHMAGATDVAAEEEAGLRESMVITAALTAVADIAHNTTIAPEVLRERRAQNDRRKAIAEQVVAYTGKERQDSSVPFDFSHLESMKDMDQQELEEDLARTQKRIERVTTETLGAAAIVGPLLTSYISSSAAEQATTELTQLLTRGNYQKRLLEIKSRQEQREPIALDDQELRQDALDAALKKINGVGGWNHLLITVASNGFSNGIIGGPPFITSLLQSRSPKEIAEHFGIMSTTGIAYSDTIASLSLAGFLASTKLFNFPGDPTEKAKFYARMEKDFLHNQWRTLVKLKEAGWEDRNVAFGGRSHFGKEVYTQLFELIQNPNSQTLQQIATLIRDMNDPFISFSLPEYIAHKQKAIAAQAANSLVLRTLTTTHFREEITAREERSDLLSHTLRGVMQLGHDHVDLTPEQRVAFAVPEDTILRQQLLDALSQGGKDTVLAGLTKAYEQLEEAGPEEGESPAIEQLKALLTQLPAVPSLVQTAQSAISQATESMQGSTADKIRSIAHMVLLSEAFLSSCADNVAAMLYARNVLDKALAQTFGKDNWQEEYPQLDLCIRLATLMTAVWGGAHSRIGNGSNFIIQGKKGTIDTKGKISLENDAVNLGTSFANPYSFLQTGPGIFALFHYLDTVLAASNL